MKRSKRDKELTDTIPHLIPHAEPNTKALRQSTRAMRSLPGGIPAASTTPPT